MIDITQDVVVATKNAGSFSAVWFRGRGIDGVIDIFHRRGSDYLTQMIVDGVSKDGYIPSASQNRTYKFRVPKKDQTHDFVPELLDEDTVLHGGFEDPVIVLRLTGNRLHILDPLTGKSLSSLTADVDEQALAA